MKSGRKKLKLASQKSNKIKERKCHDSVQNCIFISKGYFKMTSQLLTFIETVQITKCLNSLELLCSTVRNGQGFGRKFA